MKLPKALLPSTACGSYKARYFLDGEHILATSIARHATLVPPRMKGKGYWDSLNLQGTRNDLGKVCLTLCNPMDCSLPGSSVHGIFQARILEWVAISSSRGSSQPRDQTQVFRIAGRCFKLCVTREAIRSLKFSFKGIHTHIPPKIWRHTLPHQCSFSVCTLKHGPEMGVFQSQLNQGKWLLYLSDLLS